jgi:cytochrome c oxidase assembly protein subunit 15
MHLNLRQLVFISVLLAIVVVGLGAYTRLTHAGLGCPDWPGCYGHYTVPSTEQHLEKAAQAFPDKPVEPEKAWNEMIHRYCAGTLGLLVFIIATISIKRRFNGKHGPFLLPIFILLLIVFQAALGMWTVTLKLMPVVVMAHLLGGFTTLSLLFLLYLRLTPYRIPSSDFTVKKYANAGVLAIIILVMQITLGGWTSSNYAAMSCVELPICQSGWVEQLTFDESFDLIPPEKHSYEFGHLDHDQRVTIHVAHRFGAIITAFFIAWLAIRVIQRAHTRFFVRSATIVLLLLIVQVSLGISNIVFQLPLAVAVSHNIVAALLMLSLITLTYSLKRKI